MNIDKLTVGMIIKNYKELCGLLGEPVKSGGNIKKAQLKEFDRHFKYHKDGNKFIIDEIYSYSKKKNDGRSNKSMNYIENIETLILGMLFLNGIDNRLSVGKSILLREVGLVNNNYSYCKRRPHKVAKVLECDLSTVAEYFKLNNKALIGDIEKALKNLRSMRLIQFNTVQMVCKVDSEVIGHDHKTEIDDFGDEEVTFLPRTKTNFTYEVASDNERELILFAEKKALSQMGLSKVSDVFTKNKVSEYYKLVNSMVRMDIPNFHFYFGGYDIVFNEEHVIEELQHRGYDEWFKEDMAEHQKIVNDGAIVKINSNAKTRRRKALKEPNTKNAYRTSDSYIKDTKTLNDNVIKSSANSIKSIVKTVKA